MTMKNIKRTIISLFFLCILVCPAFWSCTSKADATAYQGFADSFSAAYTTASKGMDVKIQSNLMGYKDALLKLNKLEQVGNAALSWIDYMQKRADKELWSPIIAEVTSDLFKYKNDRYEVIKLQFVVERSSVRKYSSIIKVFEVYTNKQYLYDDIHSDLKKQVDDLNKTLTDQINAYKLSAATTNKVLGQYSTWKVSKINSSSYKVSGPALGWSGTTLAPGVWTYNIDNQAVTPADAGSTALDKVIKGQ
jgi:hypothetical protein